ncbi:MAG: MFS transporter [Dehalococcoidia bacterium]|jgi:MFS family permease|nr:MFS transporter [Dehalococcoidia bacterium]|tara:strand:- start:2668 stop:3891 length:1224 start_codon:yes stop_codon:yes gene_type:complete
MSKISKPFSGLSLVIGLSLGHGIKHFGQGALTVIGPLLKASMGLSEVSYALIFSSMNVSSGLSNIPAGILSDMYRKKIAWFLAISMFTISIGYLLIGITKIYILILLGVILIGFGTSFWHAPAFGTLAARYPERKGFALSMHLTGAQIGNTIGPPIIGGLISGVTLGSIIKFSGFGWENVAIMIVIPMIITGILVLTMFKSAGSESTSNWSFEEYWDRTKTLLADKIILGLIVLGAMRASIHTSFQLWLAVYLKEELDYSAWVIGWHIALITAAGIISTPIMGILSDRFGRKPVIQISMTLMAIYLFLFLIFDEGLGLVILIGLLGMFFFSVMPIVTAATMDRVPKGSEGSGTALNFIGMSLIGFMAPVISGIIYKTYNFEGIAIFSGIIAISGILLCTFLPMKKIN